ncbi:hypothetical protein D3C73_1274790 [compost metagenome]
MCHGNVDQLAPHLQTVLVAALQLHHIGASALGKIGVFVIVFLRFAVELFQVGQTHIAGVLVLHFFQIGD